MRPREAITAQCKEGVGSIKEIEDCKGDKPLLSNKPCASIPLRLGKSRSSDNLIRKYCLSCMCGSHDAVRYCPSEKCNLYYFRFGKKGGL